MGRAKKQFNFQRWLIAWLRRGSYRVPGRYTEVKNKARKERGIYACNDCKRLLRNGEYDIDHITPVIDPKKGFTTWEDYITRLFVDASGLQLLCKPCHSQKTQKENQKRRKMD